MTRCQKCFFLSVVLQWALAGTQTMVFHAGVETALSLKPLASITGTAAEWKDGALWAFHNSELCDWRPVWIAMSECINHVLPHQRDYAGLQLSTFTSRAVANCRLEKTQRTCTGVHAIPSERSGEQCSRSFQRTHSYSDVSPIDFLAQMTDVTARLCQRSH